MRFRLSLLVSVLVSALSPIAPAEPQSYREWLQTQGLPTDGTGQGAQTADAAGDGVQNLMKFALGLNAWIGGYQGRLTHGVVNDGADDYLALTYTQPDPAPAGVVLVAALGDTPSDLSAGGTEIPGPVAGGTRTITVRDIEPIGGEKTRRFMQLTATAVPIQPRSISPPAISGTATLGQTLTAATGTWDGGAEAPAYTFQWLRNGQAIDGATGTDYRLGVSDVNATITARVTATNTAGTSEATSAAVGPVASAPVPVSVVVRADGWTADVVFYGMTTGGTYHFGTDAAPAVRLSVTSPGYNENGGSTSITREMLGTVALRQPYPNQTTNTEALVPEGVRVTIALSDRIHVGDTITGCTFSQGVYVAGGINSAAANLPASVTSTLPYQKPIANWLAFPSERAASGAATFDIELLAFHRFPRQGRQVACVEFIATDEHSNTVTVKSSTMVQSTRVTTGNPIAVYRGSIPLATLSAGDQVTVRAKIYPFLGDGTGVFDSDPSADGAPATVPSGFANYTFLNDKTGTYGTVYAYVSPGGNDAGGVASEVAATASASPFQSIYAAANAVKARNNTLYGHNDLGGGVVRLTAGTYAGFGSSSLNTLGSGKTWFTIEAAPGESVSTVSIEPGTKINPGNMVKFKNLALTPTASTPIVIDAASDGAVDGPPIIYGAYEGLRIHGLSGVSPIIYRVGLRHFIGCDMKDIGRSLSSPYGITREHTPLLAGCTLSFSTQVPTGGLSLPTWTSVGNMLSKGFYFTQAANTAGTAPGSTRVVAAKSAILAFNSEYGAVSTNSFGFTDPTVPGGGMAIVQNLFEFITNTSSPCFNLAGDGAVKKLDNVVVQHMTVVGARMNYLYNDEGAKALAETGSKSVPKNGIFIYSLVNQYNCKTDTFSKPGEGPDGERVGNWEPHHGIGFAGNMHQNPAANGPAAPYTGPNSWDGVYLGRNSKVAGNANFVSDLSLSGANTGGGDYRIGAASDARNRVPAGFATLPFDLDGTPRRNDGTGAAGAYEYQP